jgi:hypothetical protein
MSSNAISATTAATSPSGSIFVLDENFPQPFLAIEVLRKAIRRLSVDIKLLEEVGSDLFGSPDDHLIRVLDQRGVEGLFTCDEGMIYLPEVQHAIAATGFTVVTVRGGTSDPIMATGVILAHLREIAAEHQLGQDQIWRLGTRRVRPITVAEHRAKS